MLRSIVPARSPASPRSQPVGRLGDRGGAPESRRRDPGDVSSAAGAAAGRDLHAQLFTAATAQKVLAEVAPDAKITEGEDAYQLIVSPVDEHAKIEETLRRIDAEGAAGGSEKAVVYELEAVDSRLMFYIIRFLWSRPRGDVRPRRKPEAACRLGPAQDPREDQGTCRSWPTRTTRRRRSFTIRAASPPPRSPWPCGRWFLTRWSPAAIASQMVVWARPADQEKIKQVVDQLTAADSADLAPTAYRWRISTPPRHADFQLAAPRPRSARGRKAIS